MADRPTDPTLEGVDWRLTVGVDVAVGRPISARFVDGTVSGSVPVNRYRATYVRNGERLTIGPATRTLMAGPAAAMAAEDAYLRLLESVASFVVEGDRLALRDQRGDPILEYEPAPSGLLALDGPWRIQAIRRGDGVVLVRPGSDAALTFDAEQGSVSGSTGVNQLSGRAQVHDGRVTLGPFRMTRMAGPPEAMDEEQDLLRGLEDAVGFDLEPEQLRLLDADGGTLVVLVRPEA
jgi:heat shock protein HslJ